MRSKRAARRGSPIHAYVGPNGGGKSLAMVNDTLPSLDAGRPVLSTVRLLDWRAPCMLCESRKCPRGCPGPLLPPHPLYTPFTDYRQLLDWRGGDVLMDEVTGVASSRESMSLPPQVANYLVQLRRRDVLLRWTAPNWLRADKIMREVSLAVTYCIGYLPKTRCAEDGQERLWRDRRLFYWRTYDATVFDEFSAHKRENVKASARELFWRPSSHATRAYDTLDAVESLGATVDGGLCITCNGKRRPIPCSCPDQRPSRPTRAQTAGTLARKAQPRTGVPSQRRSRRAAVPAAPADGHD